MLLLPIYYNFAPTEVNVFAYYSIIKIIFHFLLAIFMLLVHITICTNSNESKFIHICNFSTLITLLIYLVSIFYCKKKTKTENFFVHKCLLSSSLPCTSVDPFFTALPYRYVATHVCIWNAFP